ncbi:hypothetical protein AUP68_14340 [Ilyonectria robusta]
MSQNDIDWSRALQSTITGSKFGDQNTVILGNVDQSITNIFTSEQHGDPHSTTLCVAAAIARFVDYSIKLVVSMRDRHLPVDGILSEFADLDTVTKSLEILHKNVEGSLKQGREDRSLTSNSKTMYQIAIECRRIGTTLFGILKTLTDSQRLGRLKNLRLAITNQVEIVDTESLVSKLQDLRQQLVPLLLGSLREQVESPTQSQRAGNRDHKAVGEAFLSHVDVEEKRKWRDDLILAIHASHNEDDNVAGPPTGYPDSETTRRFSKLAIDCMRFSEIKDREDNIADAYRKTFEWIFHDPEVGQTTWSSFTDWLQSDSSLYWITGKAGSGKSTLMKYLYRDPRTVRLLSTWASAANLVTAGFFFWNSGTDLQMSQSGLIRSLLCQILASKPSMAASLFPEEWEMYAILGVRPSTFSPLGLRRAFRALKQACACETTLCLFVDGLDEFDGRSMDLVDLLKDILACPQIKICTASRPWVEFEEAFRTVPSLRLQDLTKPDITRFVSEKFQGHSMFSEILKHEEFGEDLVRSVTERASGVFLWVHLVVQSLLDGLTRGDGISDLQARLDSIPSDLEGLFQKILDSIQASDLAHASQLFQIHRAALEPLSLLGFYFADGFDQTRAKTEDIMPMSDDKALFKAKMMARRLNSRCKGLLEVGNPNQTAALDVDVEAFMIGLYSLVRYLHRSVRDWLESPEIWAQLLTGTRTPFNARVALSKSFLLQLQTSKQPIEMGEFWHLIYSSVFFAWKAEDIAQAKTTMAELHRAFCRFRDIEGKIGQYWPSGLYPAEEIFLNLAVYCNFDFSVETQLRSSSLRPSLKSSTKRMSPLHRAVTEDIASFSEHVRNPYSQKLKDIESLFKEGKTAAPSVRCIVLLFEHGADPNEEVPSGSKSAWNQDTLTLQDSVWTVLLSHCIPELVTIALRPGPRTGQEEDVCRTWLLILSVFLSSGVTWTRGTDRYIKAKILKDELFQTQFGDELEQLRLALKKSRGTSKRFSIRKILGR